MQNSLTALTHLFPRKLRPYFYIFLSLGILLGAQPDWNKVSSILAATCGYALFWKGMLFFESRKARFFLALFWFALAQTFHLSWFYAIHCYIGLPIYFFIPLLSLGISFQFAILSLFIVPPKGMSLWRMLALCGGWTLMEWSRLFLLTGFSWDPVGLSLTATEQGMQMASLFGVYGLSFWVILTNLFCLKLLCQPRLGRVCLWLSLAIAPYLFGTLHIAIQERLMEKNPQQSLTALLVQPYLLPHKKMEMGGSVPLSADKQWERILALLAPQLQKPVDLIVFPESVFPYGTDYPIYSSQTVFQTFEQCLHSTSFLPEVERKKVGNRFWTQGLCNAAGADLIIGLEDVDFSVAGQPNQVYNAALHFHPFASDSERYEKRVLVPFGEYIPFQWCRSLLSKYGIGGSFTAGSQAKLFQVKDLKAGISICYEETYGNLMLENRKKGADLLINITNDGWYPFSRLPAVHLAHGRLRCTEGGIPGLRACNTGVTCAIDSLGRLIDFLPFETKEKKELPGVLLVQLPLYQYKTLYSIWGDRLIIFWSLFVVIFNIILRLFFLNKKRNSFKSLK